MVKILSAKQIKELDAYTIKHEPIASIDLMERACRAFTTWITEHCDATLRVAVVCGTGNNGGDGLGIARMLKEWGYVVKVWIIRGSVSETQDFSANLNRLKNIKVEIVELGSVANKDLFNGYDLLIDAVFGSGLSRPVEGIYADVIREINHADAIRIAVDIPSGLMADNHSTGEIVKADYTISFQLPKLIFFFPHYHEYVGKWELVDIGLSKIFINEAETLHYYVSRKEVKKILKPRPTFSHKGNFGHALLIVGSYGKIGAAVLASRAALRTGAGLVTVHIPRCGYTILQTTVPEAMASIDTHEEFFTSSLNLQNFTTIGIGPGLGKQKETIKAFASVLENFRNPIVIDADALNILGEERALLHLVPEGSILTPHPKEFERLVGNWENDFQKLEKQKQLAQQLKSVVVLKGAYTSIATHQGEVYFNSTGNPGMAKGGSGDVLTGILTALLAQKYSSVEAAILGVYIHGLAGDFATREKGEYGLIATDLVESLPLTFRELSR